MELSEQNNSPDVFWRSYIRAISQMDKPLAKVMGKFDFPNSTGKMKRYSELVHQHHSEKKTRFTVMDNFHYIKNPVIISFIEHAFINSPPAGLLFLISRSTPRVNAAELAARYLVFNISEEELCFTREELVSYFRQFDISLQQENGYPKDTMYEIMQDTKGWAFAINLIARSYHRAPGYTGYLRSAVRDKIFKLIDSEVWNEISEALRCFLVRLSLINHSSVEIVTLLAEGDKDLLAELERQNAYLRYDGYINAYVIQPLFLEFLRTKKDLLSEEQKRQTHEIAGKWCDKNGFRIDAISHYEAIGDYESIVNIFIALPPQIPQEIARHTELVLARAPVQLFDTVLFLASTHLRSVMCQGLWQTAMDLAQFYENKYLLLPKNDAFRTSTLASVYYCWIISCAAMNLSSDFIYDASELFRKFAECFPRPIDPGDLIKHSPAPWICVVGSSHKGALEEYINALKQLSGHLAFAFGGHTTGEDDLAWGEFKFYQGDINAAETFFARGLDRAREKRQHETVHRALFYTLRIAFYTGNYAKVEQTQKKLEAQLEEANYFNRFVNYDISLAWYYYTLGQPKNVPKWLQGSFSPYCYAGFIENYANQVKARYCYMTHDYPPLLSYIQEMKKRESFLFGRVEMLAIEACVHYKMKNIKKACLVLTEAYQTACPNDLLMPFIELGKDMRTLTAFVLKEQQNDIPKSWLIMVNRKASSYSKRVAHIVNKYKQVNGTTTNIAISSREREILTDLSYGLSRVEIAANRNLSINTVKMVISNVYIKLGAEKLADAIRIAIDRKIL
jgi:LuxR family maltose regulon positive regulatory protein